jgi:hypothetical protein
VVKGEKRAKIGDGVMFLMLIFEFLEVIFGVIKRKKRQHDD